MGRRSSFALLPQGFHHHGTPEMVTIDKSGASTVAPATLNAGKSNESIIAIRQRKYLNNRVENDRRNIKRRIKLMTGFRSFRRPQTILAGVELYPMIRKGQYKYQGGDGLLPSEHFYRLAVCKNR